ncbi:hypothetical protein K474DRAFT_1654961 [Panus rudis PR-1116 ss-1]|nr:hypothetical protein K474DRAFT_1654961 [Panus rudis PR-1116 ss-1]
MENPPYVPYVAYKSKRHSRNISNQHLVPNVAPPPTSRPPAANGHVTSEPIVPQHRESADADKPSFLHVTSETASKPYDAPRSMSMAAAIPQHNKTPSLTISVTPSTNGSRTPSEAPTSPTSPREHQDTQIASPALLPSSPVLSEQSTVTNGKGKEVDNTETPASSSTTSPTTSPRPASTTRKVSTFRHVPLRPSSTRPPSVSSPLRPPGTHARTASNISSSSRHLGATPEAHSRASSTTTTPMLAGNDRTLPIIPSMDLNNQHPAHHLDHPIRASTSPPAATFVAPPPRTSSLAIPPAPPPKAVSPTLTASQTSQSQTQTPYSASPASSSVSLPATKQPVRALAPYRPGFQPKGVYRPRTDEFLEARRVSRDKGRVERARLERRLEKLINLHFPPPGKEKEKDSLHPRPNTQNRRQSSFFDLTFQDLKSKSMSDIWKEAIQPVATGGKSDTRAAEQMITPWEDDATVSQCPLCAASFHPLTNRKHHCRLCGRIICSLPVKYPQRPQPCSLLFVADPVTGQIEEVKEGVDYGVRRRNPSISQGKGKTKQEDVLTEDEKFLKGVRICRDCRPVLLRRQYTQEIHRIPIFSKLYDAFVSLEKEIEDALPQFQELVLSLSNDEQPSPEASAARKRLLEAFAQYDALAKRIAKLPCPGGRSSSQARVQAAIQTRANLFLQKNMFPLQSLPKPKKPSSKAQAQEPAPSNNAQLVDPDSEIAHALQPLLEQEALLESFVEEAKAHRKFEDVKTLKANLTEIRAEIDRMLANAEDRGNMQAAKRKS